MTDHLGERCWRSRVKKAAGVWTFCFPAVMALVVLCAPSAAADGAREGISLCVQSVIPSLFPFLVLSPGLADALRLGIGRLFGTANRAAAALFSAFVIGMTAGFPIGAVTLISFYRQGVIGADDAARFLGVCTGASPAFLIGYFGQALWADAALGRYAWALQCAVCFAGFLFLLHRSGGCGSMTGCAEERCASLSDSLREAVPRMAQICGAVVFFSVIRAMLCRVLPGSIAAMLGGLLEMTGGLRECAVLYERGTVSRFAAMICSAAMIGFGGVCVGMQTAGAIARDGIPIRQYLRQRAVLGVTGALLAGVCLWFVM